MTLVLPVTWNTIKLGTILNRVERFEKCDEITEYQFAGTYSFARGIFLSGRKFGSTFSLDKVQRIHAGDFVYCKIMAWEGAFGIVPEEAHNAVMSGAFVAYEVDQTIVEPKYLEYYFKLESVWKTIGSQSTGTNIRRRSLHPEQFEAAEICLPTLEEQRRIVGRIEELAGKMEEARGLRRKADEETARLKHMTLTQGYDLATDIAGGTRKLAEVCVDITDGTHVTPRYVEHGVPFVSIKDMSGGFIDFSNVKYILPEEHAILSRRCKPEYGDILLSKVGSNNGMAVVVDTHREFSIFVSLALIKLDKTKLESRFAEHMLNSTRLRELSETSTRGVGYKNLVLKFIREFPIPVPPLEEQQRIVAYLDELQGKVERLKALQRETGAELDALLPSILDKAFKGEL